MRIGISICMNVFVLGWQVLRMGFVWGFGSTWVSIHGFNSDRKTDVFRKFASQVLEVRGLVVHEKVNFAKIQVILG